MLHTGSKPIYIWVLTLFILTSPTKAYVNTLKGFSDPEPIRKQIHFEPPPAQELLAAPGDAILWHAPPYKLLAQALSTSAENLRKQQALNILISAATDKTKKKIKSNDELIAEISKQFLIYRENFFISSRDPEWLARIDNARSYLNYTCSETAVQTISKLYLGDNNEINTNSSAP